MLVLLLVAAYVLAGAVFTFAVTRSISDTGVFDKIALTVAWPVCVILMAMLAVMTWLQDRVDRATDSEP